jgi:NADH-quinone oxidoreductase subunit N
MIIGGFLFKMSIVPLHLWTADVYEGAPTMITAYLSVISKGAIAFIFFSVLTEVFQLYANHWSNILAVAAVITMTIGNLFALQQTNIKRLLAFSSITQAGYILFAMSGNSNESYASVVYFILVYIFSNIAAFGVVSEVSEKNGKGNIADFKGLYAKDKMTALLLMLSLFSLAGIPPTAGFFGKFFLLSAAAFQQNYILLIVAALNMVLSLYYYLRVVRVIIVDDGNEQLFIKPSLPVKLAYVLCAAGIILTGMGGFIFDYIHLLSLN